MSAVNSIGGAEQLTTAESQPLGSSQWDELSTAEIDEAAELIPDEAIVTESHGMLTAILA